MNRGAAGVATGLSPQVDGFDPHTVYQIREISLWVKILACHAGVTSSSLVFPAIYFLYLGQRLRMIVKLCCNLLACGAFSHEF